MLAPTLILLVAAKMTSCSGIPKLKMNDGREMPGFALGTYLGFDQNGIINPKNNQLRDAVLNAIDLGYRHFDTAAIYGTEHEIGEAVRMKIDNGELNREDVFITTKLWNTHHKREQVPVTLRESLKNLGLNYVDLYLIHWPIGLNEDNSFSNVDYMETWRGMEDVVKLGLAKSIGVSNFNVEQLKRVLEESTIKPAAIQIEVNPQLVQDDLINFAQTNGLIVMGYSPLGTLVHRFGLVNPGMKIDNPDLTEIVNKHKKTMPQIFLRWLVERGVVPIVKSINPQRQAENINIFDFHLNDEEVKRISNLNSNTRLTLPSFWQSHPYYPFEKIDNPISDPFKVVN